jgi:hypothetical protein
MVNGEKRYAFASCFKQLNAVLINYEEFSSDKALHVTLGKKDDKWDADDKEEEEEEDEEVSVLCLGSKWFSFIMIGFNKSPFFLHFYHNVSDWLAYKQNHAI